MSSDCSSIGGGGAHKSRKFADEYRFASFRRRRRQRRFLPVHAVCRSRAAIDIVRRRSTRARRQTGMAAFCRCLVDKGVSLPRSINGSIDRSILPPAMIRSSCKLPHVSFPFSYSIPTSSSRNDAPFSFPSSLACSRGSRVLRGFSRQ